MRTFLSALRRALTAGAVALALLLAPVVAQATYHGYPDVEGSDWYVIDGSFDYVTEHDLITGYADGTFGPADAVSRAQAVTVLWRMAGEPAAEAERYPDCNYSDESFYGDVVTWARAAGVATGYEDGTFGPDDPVTREQLATMLANYASRVAGLDVSSDGAALDAMPDAADVTLRDGMAWVVDESIITGDLSTGTALALPQRSASRAELAKMVTVFQRDVVAPAVEAVVCGADGAEESVLSTQTKGATYLFLPSCTDLSALRLSFPERYGEDVEVSFDGEEFLPVGSEATLDLSGLPADADGVRTIELRAPGMSVPRELRVMVSESVSSLYLTSEDPVNEGRVYVEADPTHSAKAKGSMRLLSEDGSVVYDGDLTQIKGRGNSTWSLDKKPYQIKLDKKCDLLQTGNEDNENKTWVLLANAADATQLRNTVAYELAQALGLETAPEFAPVDLYYDGEYRGSYLLCEKVEINEGRVDIHKLEDDNEDANPGVELDELPLAQGTNRYGYTFQYAEGMTDPDDISGGYLLELDSVFYSSERCWFKTSAGTFVVKEPESLSFAEMTYISETVQQAIDATDPERTSPAGEVSDYIDVTSFAQVYMVNQLSKNIDWHASSAYFYLPAEGDAEKRGLDHVLYAGPVWDFDTAFGVRTDADDSYLWRETSGYIFLDSYRVWYARCPEVMAEVGRIASERGDALAASLVTGGEIASVDELAAEISASERMDETLWGFRGIFNCVPPLATYEENLSYLRSWIADRAAWLAQNGWVA